MGGFRVDLVRTSQPSLYFLCSEHWLCLFVYLFICLFVYFDLFHLEMMQCCLGCCCQPSVVNPWLPGFLAIPRVSNPPEPRQVYSLLAHGLQLFLFNFCLYPRRSTSAHSRPLPLFVHENCSFCDIYPSIPASQLSIHPTIHLSLFRSS